MRQELPNVMQEIRRYNTELAAKLESNGYFVTSSDIGPLMQINRLMMVMVRCGNGRFVCPVQDVTHFLNIIKEHSEMKGPLQGDYVRDVSIPS